MNAVDKHLQLYALEIYLKGGQLNSKRSELMKILLLRIGETLTRLFIKDREHPLDANMACVIAQTYVHCMLNALQTYFVMSL